MRLRSVLLAVALAVVVTATAGVASGYAANSGGFAYAGQRDAATNTVIAAAAAWGSAWLAAHGETECATKPGGRLMMAPDLGHLDDGLTVAGLAAECDVWIGTPVVVFGNTKTRAAFAQVCEVVTHELAHTAGMSHADMDASGLSALWTAGCRSDFAVKAALFAKAQAQQSRGRRSRHGRG